MLLLRTERLPEGPDWFYGLKLDGYRALAFKSYGVAHLPNNKSFDGKYPTIVQALARLPDETVIDGEVVARDPDQVALIPSSYGHSRHTHSRTRGRPRPSTQVPDGKRVHSPPGTARGIEGSESRSGPASCL